MLGACTMLMPIIINLLIALHLMALAMGVGGGLALSQVGPRLVAAPPDQRAPWWPLVTVYSRISRAGVVLLLITGPPVLWLKYGGGVGVNDWFKLKMLLVVVLLVSIGVGGWGTARLKRGDEGGGKLMKVSGTVTMLTVTAIVLAAVFAFN